MTWQKKAWSSLRGRFEESVDLGMNVHVLRLVDGLETVSHAVSDSHLACAEHLRHSAQSRQPEEKKTYLVRQS